MRSRKRSKRSYRGKGKKASPSPKTFTLELALSDMDKTMEHLGGYPHLGYVDLSMTRDMPEWMWNSQYTKLRDKHDFMVQKPKSMIYVDLMDVIKYAHDEYPVRFHISPLYWQARTSSLNIIKSQNELLSNSVGPFFYFLMPYFPEAFDVELKVDSIPERHLRHVKKNASILDLFEAMQELFASARVHPQESMIIDGNFKVDRTKGRPPTVSFDWGR